MDLIVAWAVFPLGGRLWAGECRSTSVRYAISPPSNGALAAVPRAPTRVYPLGELAHPPAWSRGAWEGRAVPATPGAIHARVRVGRHAVYGIWLGGSVRPEVDLLVDREQVGSVRDELNNRGQYVLLGRVGLARGTHRLTIRFHGADLHPGSAGEPGEIGPLSVSSQDFADTRVVRFRPRNASGLCGRRWDWIEALAG
jgi:hypothetical protein